LQEGDIIVIDRTSRHDDVELSDAELARRRANWKPKPAAFALGFDMAALRRMWDPRVAGGGDASGGGKGIALLTPDI